MPRRGQRDPDRERFWRRMLKAWARSGQSIRGFCAAEGLSEWSFHNWRRELRKRDGARESSARVKAQRGSGPKANGHPAARPRSRFVPVRVTSAAAPIEIERAGTTIRLHGDVDAEALARVLEAVGRVPC